MNIFVSVGTGLNPRQEMFVKAVEERLRALGFNPGTIGRNTFSSDAPLHAIVELMDRCFGAVIIALERYSFEKGIERHGSDKEKILSATALPTSWNQIEAAMAYTRKLPLLVIVEEGLRCDGLLEESNDWFVQALSLHPASLNTASFNGVLNSWRDRILGGQTASSRTQNVNTSDPGMLTVRQLLGSLKLNQLWAMIIAAGAALGGAFALGTKLSGKFG